VQTLVAAKRFSLFHIHPDRSCGSASHLYNGHQCFLPGYKVAREWYGPPTLICHWG